MSDPVPAASARASLASPRHADSLADVLERVLDKGIVVAGDIRVNLLDIELLTIRIRLLISSADKAEELGMAWWRQDPFYTGALPQDRVGFDPDGASSDDGGSHELERALQRTEELTRRVAELERRDATTAPDGDTENDVPASSSGDAASSSDATD